MDEEQFSLPEAGASEYPPSTSVSSQDSSASSGRAIQQNASKAKTFLAELRVTHPEENATVILAELVDNGLASASASRKKYKKLGSALEQVNNRVQAAEEEARSAREEARTANEGVQLLRSAFLGDAHASNALARRYILDRGRAVLLSAFAIAGPNIQTEVTIKAEKKKVEAEARKKAEGKRPTAKARMETTVATTAMTTAVTAKWWGSRWKKIMDDQIVGPDWNKLEEWVGLRFDELVFQKKINPDTGEKLDTENKETAPLAAMPVEGSLLASTHGSSIREEGDGDEGINNKSVTETFDTELELPKLDARRLALSRKFMAVIKFDITDVHSAQISRQGAIDMWEGRAQTLEDERKALQKQINTAKKSNRWRKKSVTDSTLRHIQSLQHDADLKKTERDHAHNHVVTLRKELLPEPQRTTLRQAIEIIEQHDTIQLLVGRHILREVGNEYAHPSKIEASRLK